MRKKYKLLGLWFLPCFLYLTFVNASYVPVAVTGFNMDVVANGIGGPGTSTTGTLDNLSPSIGFIFIAPDYQNSAGCALPARPLPAGGIVNGSTPGVTFQLAPYDAPNCLHLIPSASSGILTFGTPVAAGSVYLLANSGNGDSRITLTAHFADNSTEVFTDINLPDWYGGNPYAGQYERVEVVQANCDLSSGSNGPRLYEISVNLSSANYGKLISGVSCTLTSGGGFPNIMGVSVKTLCDAPPAQPVALNLANTLPGQLSGSFSPSVPAADQYLVVRYPSGSTPVTPQPGAVYLAGTQLGAGVVIQAGPATSFSASQLAPATTYDFYVYAYNTGADCSGPVYRTVAPLSGSITTAACSGPSGVITVGPAGTYATLTAALTGVASGIGGPVVLELQSNYTSAGETFPVTISPNACISAVNTLTIRPAVNASGLEITGSHPGPLIDFSGARYVRIDGTPGGASGTPVMPPNPSGARNPVYLNIRNTNASGVAVRLHNGASDNRITYCDIQGRNNTGANVPAGMAGVVYVGNTGSGGNDRDTIDHCNIHGDSPADLPSIGIYVQGVTNNGYTPDFNERGVIADCNIYDFFLPGGNSAGVELNQGVQEWKIIGNSFFQTAPRDFTSGGYNRAIWVISDRNSNSAGNGFIISDNYIGGREPRCGGGAYTLNNQAHSFTGIRIEVKDGATPMPSVIRGNLISNIEQNSTNTNEDPFNGISLHASGQVNIDGNTIGGDAGNDLIRIAAANGSHTLGILMANGAGGTPVINVRKNVIGGITLPNNGSHFSGIFINNSGEYTIDSNLIGSATIPHSIRSSNTGNAARFLRGISVPSGNARLRIRGNTIANLTNNATGTAGDGNHIAGIRILSNSASVFAVDDNRVYNLISSTRGTSGGVNAALLGIGISSTAANAVSVSGNLIHSLVSEAPSQGVYLEGIFFIGNNTDQVINLFDRNFIHSFGMTDASNNAANMRGLEVSSGSGLVTNNRVRLGISPDGSPLTNAMQIWGIARGSDRRQYHFHNSVYIGGSGVSGTANRHTSAYRHEGAGPDSVCNNILVNERANAAGGSNHFDVWINTSSNAVYRNNVYGAGAGSGGNSLAAIGSSGTGGIVAEYVPGWLSGDTSSWDMDPQYINPSGTAAAVDLHIRSGVPTPAEGNGMPVGRVPQDADGEVRSGLTPVDIGADAGNFSSLPACATPAAPSSLQFINITRTEIEGVFSAPAGGSDGYLVVISPAGVPAAAPADGVYLQVGSALGAGSVLAAGNSTTFRAAGLAPGTPYDFYVYAFNRFCLGGPRYSAVLPGSQATAACSGASGVIPVGPSGTYTSLTAALSGISSGTGGPVVLELQPDYTDAGEAFPIVIGRNVCFTAAAPLTIRPASGADGLVITGANAGPSVLFDSAWYVTIDGMPGGSAGNAAAVTPAGSNNPLLLNIRNTHNAGRAIELNNASSHNTITRCDLQGQNTTNGNQPTGPAGVIYIGPSGNGGNDNNTISYCNVHSTTANTLPVIGIYSLGRNNDGLHPDFNDSNTVAGCNIYDYFRPDNASNSVSAGVELNEGVHAWTIADNSFFQTADRIYASGSNGRSSYAIWVCPSRRTTSVGNAFVISGNYIGGSEPLCGGNPSVYATASGTAGYTFAGIRIDTRDGVNPLPTSVSGNTLTNIHLRGVGTNDPLQGIRVSAPGSMDIVGNVIGGSSGNDLIRISAASGSHSIGIIMGDGNGGVVNVRRNVIGGITLTEGGNHFSGIFMNTGTPGAAYNLDSNLIGSTVTANSIHSSNNGSSSRFLRGITVPSGYPELTITNNTIANLTNSGTSATGDDNHVAGIRINSDNARVHSVEGNLIRNLTSDTRGTSGGTQAAVLGIGISSSFNQVISVSRNTIHSLVSNAPSQGVYMEGIFLSRNNTGSIVNKLDRNFIHSFDVTDPANSAANIRGLEVNGGGGLVTNNMIRLGIRPDGSSLTNAMQIWGLARGGSARHYYFHNSVYIGGAGVGNVSGRHTAAFRNEGSGVDSVMNNILVNDRINASGGSTHFSVWINSSSGMAYDHNLYGYGPGSGENSLASVSNNGTSGITAVYTPGWIAGDMSSLTGDPLYVDPQGDAANADLHIQPGLPSPVEGSGILVPYVTEDFDGEIRAAYSPVDIGADAGNFLQLYVTVTENNSPVCSGDTIRLTAGASVPHAVIGWSGPNGFSSSANTISIPNATLAHAGTYRVWAVLGGVRSDTVDTVVAISGSVVPTVTVISGSGTSICAGAAVTFTAIPTGGGTAPVYMWRKNGVPLASGSSYTDNSLVHDDVITCRLTSSATCAIPDTAISAPIRMTVIPVVVPSVSIAADPGTSICAATPVTFTATPVNGGTAPVYQWRKNGVIAGTTGPVYTDNALANGQVITCRITSNAVCAIPDTAVSNSLTMAVTPTIRPAVTITAVPSTTVCAGTPVTFSATAVNGGASPVYQWRKNGVAVAAGNSYTDNNPAQGDMITCRLISNAVCPLPDSAVSNTLAMTVNPLLTPSVSVSAGSGTTVCAGSVVTFTAMPVNGGTAPSYQWYRNAVPVGTNSSVYMDNSLSNGDVITCRITSNISCRAADTAVSLPVVMQVISFSTSVTPPGPVDICTGGSVTLTADTPGMQYQWRRYGILIGGAGGRSFTATETGDYTVTVISGSCSLTTPDPVSVSVVAIPVPDVVVNRDTLTTVPDYTAYQWHINGQPLVGATGYRHIATEAGRYHVVVTDSAGCTESSAFYTLDGLDVPGLAARARAVQIYPNPVSDVVYVRAPFPVTIFLQAADGRAIMIPEDTDAIRMDNLPDGMYMISIRDEYGLVIRHEKLIKMRR